VKDLRISLRGIIQPVVLTYSVTKVYYCCVSISLCHGRRYDRWVSEVRKNNHLEYYCAGIIECFLAEFLYRTNAADIHYLLIKTDECGFLDILWSIDCMHWQWHTCLVGWHGQFTHGTSNIIQSFLKLLLLMTVEFDILFFSCRIEQRHQCAELVVIHY
jgi:hypothetical protein